jgi:hypothetical protein
MSDRTLAKTLGRNVQAEKRDAAERVTALRLQAMAWRHLALIGLVDQEYARSTAQWLLWQTVPFTNGPAIEKFIAETADRATQCAIEAGVCTDSR